MMTAVADFHSRNDWTLCEIPTRQTITTTREE